MKEIGSSGNYKIAVDTTKNRIYFSFFGDALNASGIAGLPEATKDACALMKPGFTSLADFAEMKLLGVPDVVRKIQSTLLEAGLRKVASVWNEESFAKFIVDSSAQKLKSGEYDEKRRVFKDRLEAEAWLDE